MTIRNRRAQVPISEEVLRKALNLPESTIIRGVSYDPNRGHVVLYISSPDLPEVVEGVESPVVQLVCEWRTS